MPARDHRTGGGARHDRGVPRRRRERAGRARPLRRGGDRQDDPLGDRSRRGPQGLRPRPDLPRGRGRGAPLLRRAVRPARSGGRRAGRAIARCPRVGGRSRSRCGSPSPARTRPIRTRSGSRSSTSCGCSPSMGPSSSRSTTCSGSTRPPQECSRSPSGVCATSRSACWRPCARPQTQRLRSSSSEPFPRSGSSGSGFIRSAWAPSTACSRSGSGSS